MLDSFDARQNIFGGAQYLRILLDLFQGDVTLALAAYNAGENAVLRYRGRPALQGDARLRAEGPGTCSGGLPASAAGRRRRGLLHARQHGRWRCAPRRPSRRRRRAARRKVEPARPRTYYRWRDERGVTHVAEAPPPEGIVYATVRALD